MSSEKNKLFKKVEEKGYIIAEEIKEVLYILQQCPLLTF